MANEIDPVEYGMLQEAVSSLRRDLATQTITLNEHMKQMDKALKDIQDTLSEARGGWRVMMMFGGAAAAAGSALAYVVTHLTFKP